MVTGPICPECHRDMDGAISQGQPWAHRETCSQYQPEPAPRVDEGGELARLYLVEQAARTLVMLKDGPRDSTYHREKPKVWAELRAALAAENGEPT
jgi:hypothetical protein